MNQNVKITHDISWMSFAHTLTLILVTARIFKTDFELSWFQATAPSWLLFVVGIIVYLASPPSRQP